MKKKTVLLINYYQYTSGKLIIDANQLGLVPVLLVTKARGDFNEKVNARVIYEKETYQETLKLVKSFNPFLVFPGDENEVELASRLQKDLKIKFANKYQHLQEQTRKDKMHESLKRAGIRYIRGDVAHSAEQAVLIFKKLKVNKAIIKAPRASGSSSLIYCSNEKEVFRAASDFFKNGADLTIDKSVKDLLVQECIEGTEYFINTVSLNGQHRILQIWKDKVQFVKDRMTFINSETLDKIDNDALALVKYMRKVLDALHIKNGPVHSELIIDKNGPVLIEVNCRLSGGGAKYSIMRCDFRSS